MKSTNTIPGLFITGTNTGVGKTVITAALANQLVDEGHRIGVYKPVCSGSEFDSEGQEFWNDVRVLSRAIGRSVPEHWICPQRFSAPLAPPAAARLECRTVNAAALRTGLATWEGHADFLIVEGVGGWLSPIAEQETVADLAVAFGFPAIIVAAAELGAINHTLLTVQAVRHRGVNLAGIITNETRAGIDQTLIKETLTDIQNHTDVPILAHVAFRDFDLMSRENSLQAIDWISLMGSGRAATWTHRKTEGDEDGV